MSHPSLGSKVAGFAYAMARNANIAVPLTHSFNINLRHLQDQAQLLAEQQLQDYTDRDSTDLNYKRSPLRAWNGEKENQLTDLQLLQMSAQRQSHDFLQTPSPAGSI